MGDGIIILPVGNEGKHIKEVIDGGIPVVLMDRLVRDVTCDAVLSDNKSGSYEAVKTLINHGHRRIGIIAGPQDIYTAYERLEGYYKVFEDYKINIDESLIVYSDYTQEGGEAAFKQLMKVQEPPSAVFTTNYENTLGAVKLILEKGLKIGEDISLFGYDRMETFQILNPPISVIMQPMDAIGKRAAEILIKRMRQEYDDFPIINRLKTKAMITNSIKVLA